MTGNFWIGLATIGLVNNAVNFVYYTFISDGTSDLTPTSYHDGYLNRWERLDYAKHETKQSWYNFNAWMYNSEYTFHAHVWWLTGWAYVEEGSDKKYIPLFSRLAGSAHKADVVANDPLSDWNNKDINVVERILRMIAYFAEGILGF